MLLRIVLAVREAALRQRLQGLLTKEDLLIETVDTRGLLWERMTRKSCDLVVACRQVVPEPDAQRMRLLHELPDAPVLVILSANDSPEERARFVAAGYDMVLNPSLTDTHLRSVLLALLNKRREHALRYLVSRPLVMAQPSLADFISHSPAMQQFVALAGRVINSDSSLLILGETGVGKEWLARAIHAESPRCKGPFIAVNCGAFPEGLLESELFGHEEGAFTGASRAHRGCFELAHHGVIFLDEIAEMPNHLQVKLLRVLQEHEVKPVGGEKSFPVDVRVMAATNRNVKEEVEAKRLRQDLYYRLNVVTLSIPPLRERREDIPDLVQSYLKWLRPRVGRNVSRISAEALQALGCYAWPGNVRELINVIERAMLLCADDQITLADLPESFRTAAIPTPSSPSAADGNSKAGKSTEWPSKSLHQVSREAAEQAEREYLIGQLRATGGRIDQAARRAGIQPRSLFTKMKRYGLKKEDFRH